MRKKWSALRLPVSEIRKKKVRDQSLPKLKGFCNFLSPSSQPAGKKPTVI
jgi:hypothetical protein